MWGPLREKEFTYTLCSIIINKRQKGNYVIIKMWFSVFLVYNHLYIICTYIYVYIYILRLHTPFVVCPLFNYCIDCNYLVTKTKTKMCSSEKRYYGCEHILLKLHWLIIKRGWNDNLSSYMYSFFVEKTKVEQHNTSKARR